MLLAWKKTCQALEVNSWFVACALGVKLVVWQISIANLRDFQVLLSKAEKSNQKPEITGQLLHSIMEILQRRSMTLSRTGAIYLHLYLRIRTFYLRKSGRETEKGQVMRSIGNWAIFILRVNKIYVADFFYPTSPSPLGEYQSYTNPLTAHHLVWSNTPLWQRLDGSQIHQIGNESSTQCQIGKLKIFSVK